MDAQLYSIKIATCEILIQLLFHIFFRSLSDANKTEIHFQFSCIKLVNMKIIATF